MQIKSAVNKLPGKIMGNSALEAFSSDEKNLLAAIFLDAYGDEEGPAVVSGVIYKMCQAYVTFM